MQLSHASQLAQLLRLYGVERFRYQLEEHWQDARALADFHQWADDRPFEGAFLVRSQTGAALWILLIDWKKSQNYYLVLFPEDKNGPLAEVHRTTIENGNGDITLHWKYSPTKRDNKNAQRREYFATYFLSPDVEIAVPSNIAEVSEFLDGLFYLVECRSKADALDENRPTGRNSFPEGKLKERLHRSRERNPAVVREAKRLALQQSGALRCVCCGFDFSKIYGPLGEGFIEVHHTRPLTGR